MFITAAIVLLAVIIVMYMNKSTTRSTASVKPDIDLAFSVLGDIHENTDSFQEAIDDLYSINSYMDALVLNGDTVDQGIEKQYDSINKILSKNKELLPEKIIKNIGNHEFFDYDVGVNSAEQVQTFIKRYLQFSGEEKVYHDTWVNNYHLISLGSEDGNSDTINATMASISEEQQKWLKEKLAENYQKGKPIFVFLHQPLDFGNKAWGAAKQSADIIKIISKYPEVILFSSHTHRDLNESCVMLNQPFTTISTGAVHYTLFVDSNGERKREPFIKGLYIEVKGNTVVVKGRDVKEKKWIFTKEITKK